MKNMMSDVRLILSEVMAPSVYRLETILLSQASHRTVGVENFGTNVFDRLSSRRVDLPVSMLIILVPPLTDQRVASLVVLRGRISCGVMFRVRC